MQDKDLTPSQIVEQHWPYDGPHSAVSVAEAAEAIGRLARYMANATWDRETVGSGPRLGDLLGGLAEAMCCLDQALGQIDGHIIRWLAADPTLYDDRRDRSGYVTAAEVACVITDARTALPVREMTHAAQVASHLGHDSAAVRS